MTFEKTQTVREIAILHPGAVRVFENFGIDYCCGGRRSLQEACERANVAFQTLITELESAPKEPTLPEQRQWTNVPLADLVAYIVDRHHSYVRNESPRLRTLLQKVVGRHGEAHPELKSIQELFGALSEELFVHMMKEEQVLFPYIARMESAARGEGRMPFGCFGSVQLPISRMLADHDDAGELLAKIRELSSAYQAPENACPSYRGLFHSLEEFERDLHRHVHLENNILFPHAVELERTDFAHARH
jgi:regulator of cell morphogenesis and NO signaling